MGLINELSVESIRMDDEGEAAALHRRCAGPPKRQVWIRAAIAEVKSKLQRMSPVEQADEYHAVFGDLIALETYRKSLLQQASGDDVGT